MTFYQIIAEGLFFAFIILVILGSLITIRAKILMQTVLGLAVALLGVAGIYFYLGSMFLTLMQILIYVGAICIVLIFGIMVGYTPTEVAEKGIKDWRNKFLAVSSAVAAFLLILACVLKTDWIPAVADDRNFSAAHLGEAFLYKYCLAFELISVILLIAIIGSIILARGGAGGMITDHPTVEEVDAVQEEKGEAST
ncbi:MAG: NADH-quinone oxidoreductase subunit J [Desulfobacterales bacterium]|jgi:NADH:ubiquinone oxidoreductase subunit 6 (subunit J)